MLAIGTAARILQGVGLCFERGALVAGLLLAACATDVSRQPQRQGISQPRPLNERSREMLAALEPGGTRPPPSDKVTGPEDLALEAQLAAWMAGQQPGQLPGEHHRHLDLIAGVFQARSKWWLDPDADPVVSEGTARNEWVLGGRFLLTRYEGTLAGRPFEGVGLLGHDNEVGVYVGTWADTMATTLLPVATGTCDGTGSVLTMLRTMNDPLTGRSVRMREVLTIIDRHQHIYEIFTTGPDGREFKTLETTYTRG